MSTLIVQPPESVNGCFSSPKSRRHSSTTDGSTSTRVDLGRLYDFLTTDDIHADNQAFAIVKNVHVTNRKAAYGRIDVPYGMSHGFTLTVAAHWRRRRYNSPVWMYLRKTGLPTQSDWDKKSISYVSRKLVRIVVRSPDPGVYFVMIRGVQEESDVSISVSLLPNHHVAAGNAAWRGPGQPFFESTGRTLILSPSTKSVSPVAEQDDDEEIEEDLTSTIDSRFPMNVP